MTFSPQILALIQRESATGRYTDEQQVVLVALEHCESSKNRMSWTPRLWQESSVALADSAAGRFKTIAEFDLDFRARHGIYAGALI
jgi:hypothetical protein